VNVKSRPEETSHLRVVSRIRHILDRFSPHSRLNTIRQFFIHRQKKKSLNRTTTTLDRRGILSDGGGLCLQVARGGSRSWILRYRLGGRRWHLGLGGFRA
jgi:hypothetical protein